MKMDFGKSIGRAVAAVAGIFLITVSVPAATAAEGELNQAKLAGYADIALLQTNPGTAGMMRELGLSADVPPGEAGFWMIDGRVGGILVTENGAAGKFFEELVVEADKDPTVTVTTVDGGLPAIVGVTDAFTGEEIAILIVLVDEDTILAGKIADPEKLTRAEIDPPADYQEILPDPEDFDNPMFMVYAEPNHPSLLTSAATRKFSKFYAQANAVGDDFAGVVFFEYGDAKDADSFMNTAKMLFTDQTAPIMTMERDGNEFMIDVKSGTQAVQLFQTISRMANNPAMLRNMGPAAK